MKYEQIFAVRLDEETAAWLDAASAESSLPKAAMIRFALRRFKKDWASFVNCSAVPLAEEGED